MRLGSAALALAVGTALTGATASAGSSEATLVKQRIRIDELISASTDAGPFTFSPLTPGPLKRDKGTMELNGFSGGSQERDGMRVFAMVGRAELQGRRGTMRLSRRVDLVGVPGGLHVRTGTWKVVTGTGQYAGLEGAGRLAGVQHNGRIVVRQEGWVRR